MDSIQINTGVKRIAINGDESRVIAFNPSDIQFAERFYTLMQDFDAKQSEYMQRAEVLDQETAIDDNGLPVNLGARIAFMRDICEYMNAQIDTLFGAGTSEKAFQGALDVELITQFFEGVTPFVQTARSEKMAKYAKTKNGKRKVMK